MNYCSDYSDDIYGLIEEIKRMKSKIQTRKYQKFTLQIYGCGYMWLIDFPKCDLIF